MLYVILKSIILLNLIYSIPFVSMECLYGGKLLIEYDRCDCSRGYSGNSCEMIDCVKGRPVQLPPKLGCLCRWGYSGNLCDAAPTMYINETRLRIHAREVTLSDSLPHNSIHLPDVWPEAHFYFHYNGHQFILPEAGSVLHVEPESQLIIAIGYCMRMYSNTTIFLGQHSRMSLNMNDYNLTAEAVLRNENTTKSSCSNDPQVSEIILGDYSVLEVSNLQMTSKECLIKLEKHSKLLNSGLSFRLLPKAQMYIGEESRFSSNLSMQIHPPGIILENFSVLKLNHFFRDPVVRNISSIGNETELNAPDSYPIELRNYVKEIRLNSYSTIVLDRIFMASHSFVSCDLSSLLSMPFAILHLDFHTQLLLGRGSKLISNSLHRLTIHKDAVLAVADMGVLEIQDFEHCSIVGFLPVTENYLLLDRNSVLDLVFNSTVICL